MLMGEGVCEPRIEIIVEMPKKVGGYGVDRGLKMQSKVGRGSVGEGGGSGGCGPRIIVIVEMQKKIGAGWSG